MNQLCPFCWTELQRVKGELSTGIRQKTLPLLECPHCSAAGTSNLIHSHHAYRNAVLRLQTVISRMEGASVGARDWAGELRDALGMGLVT